MTGSATFGTASLLHHVLNLHGLTAYGLVGALAFAEAALFVGFVLPGETAVLLGGVLASMHKVNLEVEIAVVVIAAIVGDTVGYEVGRHFGEQILRLKIFAKRSRSLDRARTYLQEKGGRAVFIARFTAFLRAVMPGLAGTAQMPYRRFLAFNAAGGAVWGTGVTLLGFAAGASYHKVEKVIGQASLGLLALIVVGFVANHLRSRAKERRDEATDAPRNTSGTPPA